MKRNREPVAVGTLIDEVRPKGTLDDGTSARLFGAWTTLVPRRVLENARPVSLRRGVLVVHTATSAWASVLSLEGEQILAGLRVKLPDVEVKKLLFRVGPLPPMPTLVDPRPQAVSVPVTELPETVARELASIGDDELRGVVARAAAVGLARPPRGRR